MMPARVGVLQRTESRQPLWEFIRVSNAATRTLEVFNENRSVPDASNLAFRNTVRILFHLPSASRLATFNKSVNAMVSTSGVRGPTGCAALGGSKSSNRAWLSIVPRL